jgi:hypothetical protein
MVGVVVVVERVLRRRRRRLERPHESSSRAVSGRGVWGGRLCV